MRNTFAKTAAAVLAAALLTACSGQSASSAAPADDAKAVQNKETSITDAASSDGSEEETEPETWHSEADGIHFDIDFREYPQTSSGLGYIENQDDIALAAGATWQTTQTLYGFDPLECKDVMQLPQTLSDCMLSSLAQANWNGKYTGSEVDRTLEITKTESVTTENGYEACRFEGSYQFEGYVDYQDHSFTVVGYTVPLKQSGYPVYVLAADMSDDQANTGSLDKIAHDCIASLRETA